MNQSPNIVIIMTDHTNSASITSESQCLTPNLDALSKDGIQFDSCYTTNAICSPARASLMTSLYPSSHGVWDVLHAHPRSWLDAPSGRFIHFAEVLADHGYRNGYFGKWHVEQSNQLDDFGWHEFNIQDALRIDKRKISETSFNSNDGPSLDSDIRVSNEVVLKNEGYPDHLLSATIEGMDNVSHPAFDHGLKFINDHISGNNTKIPFTCFISVLEPHDPYLASYDVMELYDCDQITLSPSFEDDLESKPDILKRMNTVFGKLDQAQWKQIIASYYASITSIDKEVGRVIKFLKERNIYDDTLIVFTSDHGDMLSAHGLLTKGVGTGYEEVYNIPLILKPPNVNTVTSIQGVKVSTVDLAPTLLAYAGIDIPKQMQGKNLKPVLDGSFNTDNLNEAYAEFFSQRYMYTQRLTWKNEWKYIFNPGGIDELYNLDDDPFELNNLADKPKYQHILKDMARHMWRKMESIGDTTLLNTGYPSLRTAPVGPLSRFGETHQSN